MSCVLFGTNTFFHLNADYLLIMPTVLQIKIKRKIGKKNNR